MLLDSFNLAPFISPSAPPAIAFFALASSPVVDANAAAPALFTITFSLVVDANAAAPALFTITFSLVVDANAAASALFTITFSLVVDANAAAPALKRLRLLRQFSGKKVWAATRWQTKEWMKRLRQFPPVSCE